MIVDFGYGSGALSLPLESFFPEHTSLYVWTTNKNHLITKLGTFIG
jgi:hypothetical protein